MEHIYIYGAGNYGTKLLRIIDIYYSKNISVDAFIDREKEGEINGVKITKLDFVSTDVIIVIALKHINIAMNVYRDLSRKGYSCLWFFLDEKDVKGDFFKDQCINCQLWDRGVLPQVEMHIMDACNLNCRGCSHFSPIFPMNFPDFQSKINDVKALKSKIGHVEKFFILGGEPFLNPEIGDYSLEISKILPDSQLWIVSNGLLIPKVDECILEKIKQSKASISISEYKPTHLIIESIEERLSDFEIKYEIRRLESRSKFNLPLSISNRTSKEKLCISDGCVTIWNGMISRCPTLMYIEYFNEVFRTTLPSDGRYSLYDTNDNEINGWELVDKMKERVPLCDHCVSNEIEWETCGRHPLLSDFACEN